MFALAGLREPVMRSFKSDYEFFLLPSVSVIRNLSTKARTKWGVAFYWLWWTVEIGG